MAQRTGSYILNEIGLVDLRWTGLLNTDTGNGMTIQAGFWKATIQVAGTFGAAGAVVLEGSNDGATYSTLKDPQGTAISMTDNTIFRVEGIPQFVRPRVSAGDGTTSLTVSVHATV